MASGVDSSHLTQDGLWLVGELLGIKRDPGRDRDETDPSKGKWPDRYKVGIRVGADVFDVEFGDQAAAQVALTAFNGDGLQKGDTVRLAVRARAAKGYVFWMGSGETAGAGDYE